MTVRVVARPRTLMGLVMLVALLVAANVTRSVLVPDAAHFAFNVTVGALALLVGLFAGTTSAELGTERAHLAGGLRYGAVAFAVVAALVTVAAFVPSLSSAFDDGRADIGFGELLLNVAVLIPIGTVLVEELVFRGVLNALLQRLTSTLGAAIGGSLLFGLWHVFPAWRADADNAALEDVGRAGTVAGTFLATTVAGLVFVWLRLRSKSLLAPMLAHLATNTATFVAAWALVR